MSTYKIENQEIWTSGTSIFRGAGELERFDCSLAVQPFKVKTSFHAFLLMCISVTQQLINIVNQLISTLCQSYFGIGIKRQQRPTVVSVKGDHQCSVPLRAQHRRTRRNRTEANSEGPANGFGEVLRSVALQSLVTQWTGADLVGT